MLNQQDRAALRSIAARARSSDILACLQEAFEESSVAPGDDTVPTSEPVIRYAVSVELLEIVSRAEAAARKPASLQVVRTELAPSQTRRGASCWGITDGKLWFFYGYASERHAQELAAKLTDPESVRINIAHPAPVSLAMA